MSSANDSPAAVKPGVSRIKIPLMLMATVAALLPPIATWIFLGQEAVRLREARDWQANHEARVQLETFALLIAAPPCAGAVIGGLIGSVRHRARAGIGAATGALIGALIVLGLLAFAIFYAYTHMQLVF